MKRIFIPIIVVMIVLIGTLCVLNMKGGDESSDTSITYKEEEIEWNDEEVYELNLSSSTTISKNGTYYLTGTINDGMLTIDTDGYVKLILDNVSITNSNGPAIYVLNSKGTYIELKNKNYLSDGGNSELDGVIYSRDDLIIEGDGYLEITANQDGIVSNDDLIINSGNITVNSKDDGIKSRDSVVINGGSITINSEGDGIKSTNDTDTDKGYILINGGNISINSNLDGIQAETKLVINEGVFSIKTSSTNDYSKGLKANNIELNGGTYDINSVDDGIHSNGNITINDGSYIIVSRDDGIHADGLIEVNNGEFNIEAAEGIEATYVKIKDGKINISASDDGINAGNKSSNYDVVIEINGGDITIKMGAGDTDGIDSNGDLYINGGNIDITANSPFDYDGKALNKGGTIVVNGKETNTITNQMMGGMNDRNMQGMIDGNMNSRGGRYMR